MKQEEMIKEIYRVTKETSRNTEVIAHHTVQIDALFEMSQEHSRDIAWLKENVFTKQDQKKMMDSLDFLVARFKQFEIEQLSATAWLKRHDRRIDRLEEHTGLA